MEMFTHAYEFIWHRWLKRPYKLQKTLDIGEGPQLVVLVHGLASTSASWLAAARQLDSGKHRLIGYDLLGFGASPRPEHSSYTVAEHAKSLEYSIKKDFPKTPIILVAHSMGCIVASYLSANGKLKIARNILYQPPLLSITKTEKRNLHANLYRFFASKPNLILTYSRLASRMAGRMSLFTVKPEAWIAFQRSLRNTILAQQTLGELEKTKVRTDIIYGRFDFIVSRAQAKNLIATNPLIMLHKVSEIHDISPRAGRYIKKILQE